MFHFCLNEIVWQAKQMVLIEFSVNPNLLDPLNFGFYLPPHAGRAGKFLDEQRKLNEYPMDNVEAHLEVMNFISCLTCLFIFYYCLVCPLSFV